MAEFDPVLYRLITRGGASAGGKGYSVATEAPATLPKLITALEKASGSGRKAAASAGVAETTWRRWRRGEAAPSGPQRAKLDQAREQLRRDVRRKRLTPGRETALRARPPRVTVKWSMRVSKSAETRTREFPGEWISKEDWAAAWGRILDDYLTGGDGSEPTADLIDSAVHEYAAGEFDYDNVEIESTRWHN